MRAFMDQDFLLSTQTAKQLYHGVAEKLPIIDYHCHINPQEIYEDRKFDTITQVWLGGDHYKWRLMRTCGVPEELVTGSGDDREKFRAFAATLPKCMGHPVYHWSHLELQRYFGITKPLSPATADEIYDEVNAKLQNWSARKFMEASNVKAICTTDDPIDDLKWHKLLAEDKTMTAKVLPSYRPDKALNCDKAGFADYIGKLSDVVGYPITCPADVKRALLDRIDYFHEVGCLVADHGMDFAVYGDPDEDACKRAFDAGMAGEKPARADADAYKTMLLIACAKAYSEKNMVMQLHFGCLRDNNKPMWRALGPDTGFDAVNSQSGVECLGALLNSFVENDGLPKTILYSLSPADNTAIVTVMQCFQGGGEAGKIQHGSAWWFNDSRPGMRKQMEDLAGNGVLGQFIGMLTDSRSFLSYTRHEYFRRVLCELVGEWVEAGMYPNDPETLEGFIADLSYHNTNRYFNFNV